MSCNGLHCAPDLDFAYGMITRLDHQNGVLGIEIDYGVEILLINRLVCLCDEQRYRVVLHFTFHEVPNERR
jgi:hypothetical protein